MVISFKLEPDYNWISCGGDFVDGRSSFQTEVHKSKHIFTTVPNQKHFFRHLITLEFINLWSCLSYNLHKYFWLWHHHVRLWQMITDQELSSLCDRYLPCQSHLSLDGCCANLLPSMIESFTSICQLIYASDPDNSVLLGCWAASPRFEKQFSMGRVVQRRRPGRHVWCGWMELKPVFI